jgi:hypothetical protein
MYRVWKASGLKNRSTLYRILNAVWRGSQKVLQKIAAAFDWTVPTLRKHIRDHASQESAPS